MHETEEMSFLQQTAAELSIMEEIPNSLTTL